MYDAVIVDFPDPSSFALGKLYSVPFYGILKKHVAANGLIAVQSTSPYFAKKSFWCVNATLSSCGFTTYPYHVNVPSFGEWGYVLAGIEQTYTVPEEFPPGLHFMDRAICSDMFTFPKDMMWNGTEVNRLNNQVLVQLFEDEWSSVQ
jgi:spermidine synthase